MKKNYLIIALLFAITVFGQETCGFDYQQSLTESQFPAIKKAREELDAKILATGIDNYLNKIGISVPKKGALYTGTIYEIPVVVHVIESSTWTATPTPTDTMIQQWIDNANAMYASTYGNGYYPEGNGLGFGTVVPFKLVLAKRTSNCNPTTGIIRYNGDTVSGYAGNGVQFGTSNGATADQIKNLAPHWTESSYFNIYAVTTFNGDVTPHGTMGYATYPTSTNYNYDSFMKFAAISNVDNRTLAHEFAHALGLKHPCEGADGNGGQCPSNTNCSTDNDAVCDTPPTQSLLYINPAPDNNSINPCTGSSYDDVQYNIMNYTFAPRKFTSGQRDRALTVFLSLRENLTTSLGATPPDTSLSLSLNPALCIPTANINSANLQVGPIRVKLGDIDKFSDGFTTYNQEFYRDYTSQYCIEKAFTDLSTDASSTMKIYISTIPQRIKAWIDYNNNGVFEDSEIVANSGTNFNPASSPFTASFTVPANAIKNIYLRMRVRSDYSSTDFNSCQNLTYGQTEDYAVRLISSTLNTSESNKLSSIKVVYSATDDKLILINSENQDFGNYQIFDRSGRMIKKDVTNRSEILVNDLIKGAYIIKYSSGYSKFIK